MITFVHGYTLFSLVATIPIQQQRSLFLVVLMCKCRSSLCSTGIGVNILNALEPLKNVVASIAQGSVVDPTELLPTVIKQGEWTSSNSFRLSEVALRNVVKKVDLVMMTMTVVTENGWCWILRWYWCMCYVHMMCLHAMATATSTTSNTSSDWLEATDPATGKTYFYHRHTRESAWEKPQQ